LYRRKFEVGPTINKLNAKSGGNAGWAKLWKTYQKPMRPVGVPDPVESIVSLSLPPIEQFWR
jgi:hypothetical protein